MTVRAEASSVSSSRPPEQPECPSARPGEATAALEHRRVPEMVARVRLAGNTWRPKHPATLQTCRMGNACLAVIVRFRTQLDEAGEKNQKVFQVQKLSAEIKAESVVFAKRGGGCAPCH